MSPIFIDKNLGQVAGSWAASEVPLISFGANGWRFLKTARGGAGGR
jgi:hypothetical protein